MYHSLFKENKLPDFEEFCKVYYGSLEEALDYNMYLDIISVSAWFKGYTGMTKKTLPKNTSKLYKNLSNIFKLYFNPEVIGTKIYRLANVNISNIDTVKDLYKQTQLKIGPRNILSFTSNKKYTYEFYNEFYKDSNMRFENKFAYIVLSTTCNKDNYIMDYNTIIEFLTYIKNNLVRLKSLNKFSKENSENFKQLFFIVNNTLKELSLQFYRKQQEVVLQYDEFKTKIKVEDIIYSSKFNIGE